MAIGIDNVYQQVLAIANKEQRGYITPQEFNLFARKAQNDIFEKTFIEYKDAFINPTSVLQSHKNLDMLREKMNDFRVTNSAISVDSNGRANLVELGGSELITNPDMDSTTGWNDSATGWTVSTSNNYADCDGSQTAEAALKATAAAMVGGASAKSYRVSFTLTDYDTESVTSGGVTTVHRGTLKVSIMGNTIGTVNGNGEYSFDGVAGSTTSSNDLVFTADQYFKGRIRNVSVREITSTSKTDVYWIESVYYFDSEHSMTFEEVDKKRVNFLEKYKAQTGFPLNIDHLIFEGNGGNLEFSQINTYYRENTSQLVFYPRPVKTTDGTPINPECDYVKTIASMADPKWGFQVINGKALFNSNDYVDFHLHSSEEGNLVNKILELAGISLMKPDLQQSALQNQATNIQRPAPKTYQDNTDNERTTFVQDQFPYGRQPNNNVVRRRR